MAEDAGHKKGMNVGLLIAALAVAGVAAYLSFRGNGDSDAQVDTAESAVAYICLDDGHVFWLTPAGFERLLKQGQVQSPGGPHDAQGGVLMLQCPQCQKVAAVRAQQCEADQTWFPRQQRDAAPGKCPKCGWSFYAPPIPRGEG